MDGRKQGRPDEELFLRYDNPETPIIPPVGPLRIQKGRDGKSPPPRTDSAGSSSQPAFSRPPPMPSFSAPPTHAPTAPLPYPDTDQPPNVQHTLGTGRYTPLSERERAKNATPSQAADGRRRGSNATGPSPTSPSQRARFEANDPNRPTISGYGARNPDGSIQPSRLAERRGTAPKPLPDSPGPETPDKEGLFQKAPQRKGSADVNVNPYPEYHQQYFPPPAAPVPVVYTGPHQDEPVLKVPEPVGVNRFSSTASTSTVKAQRGSPPPPETPIIPPPGGGIEARFAAAGIAGTSTLTNLQAQSAQNAAAAQRNQIYANQQPRPGLALQPSQQQPARRPWTPTEQPGGNPHGPPAVYQGMDQVPPSSTPPQGPLPQAPNTRFSPPPQNVPHTNVPPEHPLNHEMGRMNMNEEPPPAYSSITHPPTGPTSGYPNEKGQQPATQEAMLSDPNQHLLRASSHRRSKQYSQLIRQVQHLDLGQLLLLHYLKAG
jgi:hypothetical protein